MKRLGVFAFALFIACVAAVAQAVDINIANPVAGTGYSFANNVVTITAGGSYVLRGESTTNRVVVAQGVSAEITLEGVRITSGVGSPLEVGVGASVTLRLVGDNALVATGEVYAAALQVEGTSSVTIEGSGSLTATGGFAGAGIGGGDEASGGNITINGGRITATGGWESAGIGGGHYGAGGNISITGGVVTAVAGDYAAAIGGGYQSDSPGIIRISGGNVFAYSTYAAGIGPGVRGPDNIGSINITGGAVIANSIGMLINYDYSTTGHTLTTVTAGVILTCPDRLNTTNFGNAHVATSDIDSAYICALAAAAPKPDTIVIYDTIAVPDTTRDTVHVKVTVYDTLRVKITFYDTAHVRVVIYDTVRVPATITDSTLPPNRVPRDTIIYIPTYRDTIIYTYIHIDTTVYWFEVETLTVYKDTTIYNIHIIDSTIIDTTLAPDTVWTERIVEKHDTTYIVIDVGTATKHVLTDDLRASDAGDGVIFQNLTPGLPFVIYTFDGALVARGTANSRGEAWITNVPKGVCILQHDGRWTKFTHR